VILRGSPFTHARNALVERHRLRRCRTRGNLEMRLKLPRIAKMSKIALLLRLLAAIDEGRHNFEDLKERVDPEQPPSTRTLRRYLATLSDAGFPWFFDRESGAYVFEDGYSLRRMELSNNELFGFLALRGIANSLGGNIGASMDEVAEKLTHVAGGSTARAAGRPAVRVHLADPQLDGERSAYFEVLQKGQRERQSVRFAYVDKAGKRSQRHVDVYGFVVSGGRVYVVAHDRGRAAKRVFALDNVSEVKIAPQRYSIPDDFDIEGFAARSVSGIMHSDTVTMVTVAYSPVVARAARADRVVRDDPTEFLRWVLKWGAEAEVIAPPEVRASALALARAVVARYERTPGKKK